MRALALVALSCGVGADAACAHTAGVESTSPGWSFEPGVVLPMAIAAVLYATGVCNAATRGNSRIFRRSAVMSFAAGMLSLVLGLLSPLDAFADDLFSAHMVQHLLLMLVAAPLFVWSRPVLAFFWALPRRMRRQVGRWWAPSGLAPMIATATAPVPVWILFCGVFVFWHLPGPYSAAVEHEPLHVLEHLCLFLAAYLFWSVVIEASGRRRIGYGATLVFVASAAVLSGLPGALMILTERPFYAVHATSTARWGLTPLQDQQLAGLIMWVPAGLIYMAVISALFVGWLREAEMRNLPRLRPSAIVAFLALAMLTGLVGEQGARAQGAAPDTPATTPPPPGDPKKGAAAIVAAGCGACHIVPGIAGADGLVGPPLTQIGSRIFLAGILRNTPDNLAAWVMHPQSFVPGNAMPEMGLSQEQARDIAAYLDTLR